MGRLETRRLPVLFVLATLLPMAVLCWLGVRTLQQDRQLERQRAAERLKVAAERVALEIERDLQQTESRLAEGRGLRLHAGGVTSADGEPIAFQPHMPVEIGEQPSELVEAARLEHRAQDPAGAIAVYRDIANRASGAVKGEALVALGGLHRRHHRLHAALSAYDELARLGNERVAGGQPAALVALQGRGKGLEEAGDHVRLRETGEALSRALDAGGWLIDAATFDIYRELAERWGGPPRDEAAVVRAHAAAELWRRWRRGELTRRGRQLVDHSGVSMLVLWVASQEGPVAAVLPQTVLQLRWPLLWERYGLSATIAHVDGREVFGTAGEDRVTLFPRDTRLPFVLSVASASTAPDDPTRRNALLAGVVLAAGLMIAGSYGLYRVTTRELLLARQQSDFVAAVSHEFRTPLTSMRHLIDLLATRGITSEERKAHYYALLGGEAERLQRMVETLLSFGRIDAGAHVWQFEPLQVAELVAGVVEEFRREAAARPILVEVDAGLPEIRGDREALARALWNLLENAAKYSPPGTPIRVFGAVTATGDASGSRTILIGVEDRGIGIPVSEQRRVFEKFVRGGEAKRSGIRGVGVGLALVQRIVEGHGGSVTLESEVGRGSTFTMQIPARS